MLVERSGGGDEAARATIIAEMTAGLAAGGVQRAVVSAGRCPPPSGATITASSRVVMCLKGRNPMDIAGGDELQVVTLEPAEAVFVAAPSWNRPHHTEPMTFLTVDCKPSYVRFYLRHQTGRTRGSGHWLLWLSGPPGAALQSCVHLLEQLAYEREPVPITPAVNVYLQLALQLIERGEHASAEQLSWRRVRDYVDEHRAEAPSRQEVAAACGMHPNHVSRLFTTHLGESFNAYLSRVRMQLATELLAEYDLPIKVVAARCGYAQPEYFATVFKRVYRLSPRGYRERSGR